MNSYERKWEIISKIITALTLVAAIILAQYYQWLGVSTANSYLEAKWIFIPLAIILFVGNKFVKYKKKTPKEKKKHSNKKN